MNARQLLSKFIVITLVTTFTVALNAASIYLVNTTGYLMQFKFGKPGEQAKEYNLTKEYLFRSEDINDFVQDISIRRSGVGSEIYAPWTQLDMNDLKRRILAKIRNFNEQNIPSSVLRDINLNILPTTFGWDVQVQGITVVKR